MIDVVIKILNSIFNILLRFIFKHTGQIIVEIHPIFPVQEKHPNPNQIRNKLVVVRPVQAGEFPHVFSPFPDDLLQKMPRLLGTVSV